MKIRSGVALLLVLIMAALPLQDSFSAKEEALPSPRRAEIAKSSSLQKSPLTIQEITQTDITYSTSWQEIGPGVEYAEFHLSTPNNVFVVAMREYFTNTAVTLETSIAQGKLSGGFETVRSQAARYDGAINYWDTTWGNTNRVLAAVNGFYNVPLTQYVQHGMIHSGWFAKQFDFCEEIGGFAWSMSRRPSIGRKVYQPVEKNYLQFNGSTLPIRAINSPRASEDRLYIYTPQWDSRTRTDDSGTEVLVQLTRPMLIIPPTGSVTGIVREVRIGKGNTYIPFDHVVLSAKGSPESLLRSMIPGDTVGISQEVKRCNNDTDPLVDWSKAYAGLGGDFHFLRAGVVEPYADKPGATARNPRTAVAFSGNDLFLIVVDGRDPLWSVGMNMQELGTFARDTLGATEGISLDGGGSSTMVVDGEVQNNTFCNQWYLPPYCQKSFLPLTVNGAIASIPGSAGAATLPETLAPDIIARSVPNGLMVVAVEPITTSLTFTTEQRIRTTQALPVLLGPGENYYERTQVQAGIEGVIQANPNVPNGLLAKGSYWWQVNFGSFTGWVREGAIEAAP